MLLQLSPAFQDRIPSAEVYVVRHDVASLRDVQAIVGHSDPGLTMRIYAQTTNQGRRAAIDALPFVTSTPALRMASCD